MFCLSKNSNKKWSKAIQKVSRGELSVQEFVDLNEKKILYYSTPFVTDKHGDQCVNALSTTANGLLYFPAFSTPQALKDHFDSLERKEYFIVKGNLRDALSSLDAHPLIRDWGLVIDPHSKLSIGIPPHIRVKPKCLR